VERKEVVGRAGGQGVRKRRGGVRGMRVGNFDVTLPRRDWVMRLLNPTDRRIRVRYTGYAPRECTRVMESKGDLWGGRRGPELVAYAAKWLPNADVYAGFLRLQRRSRPRCGARCRDGHACRAPVVWDLVRDRPLNGRCKMHGGFSTGPKTPEAKARCAEGRRRYWAARRAEREAAGAGGGEAEVHAASDQAA
jgi:hypothetical protein